MDNGDAEESPSYFHNQNIPQYNNLWFQILKFTKKNTEIFILPILLNIKRPLFIIGHVEIIYKRFMIRIIICLRAGGQTQEATSCSFSIWKQKLTINKNYLTTIKQELRWAETLSHNSCTSNYLSTKWWVSKVQNFTWLFIYNPKQDTNKKTN